jgi:hypothetical protein
MGSFGKNAFATTGMSTHKPSLADFQRTFNPRLTGIYHLITISPATPLYHNPKPDASRVCRGISDAFRTAAAAVAALKKLGFGKTAAHDALLKDERFSAWLQLAPDGMITWNGYPRPDVSS